MKQASTICVAMCQLKYCPDQKLVRQMALFAVLSFTPAPNGKVMSEFFKSAALLFVLLNPFLVIIYLTDMVEKMDRRRFARVLLRGSLIAAIVFCCFAVLGDVIFSSIVHAEFASFQIFGGAIFLIIGLRFVFSGSAGIEGLKVESQGLAMAIAMPVMIGPGTISASVVIGKRHEALYACIIIISAVLASVLIMLALKAIHDFVRPRNEPIIRKYIEIAGRIMALYVGTVAVDMIMQGIRTWAEKF
jgi:multiple antibiotic resistance protein